MTNPTIPTIEIRPFSTGVTFIARDAYGIKDALKARGYDFTDLDLGGGSGGKIWELVATSTEEIIAENKFAVDNKITMTRAGKVIDPAKIITN